MLFVILRRRRQYQVSRADRSRRGALAWLLSYAEDHHPYMLVGTAAARIPVATISTGSSWHRSPTEELWQLR
jgi:hypothetical protein